LWRHKPLAYDDRNVRLPFIFLLAILVARAALAARDEKIDFDIPAQPVAEAISTYAEQAHMLFLYRTDLAQSVQANAVRGRYSALEALDRLLCGTGIAYELTATDTVALVPEIGEKCRSEKSADGPGTAQSGGDGGNFPDQPPFAEPRADCPSCEWRINIETVTVTARRRADRLQEYAGSATVFGKTALARAQIDGLEDVVSRISNAYFEERPGSAMNIFIRGAGTATNGSATQTDAAVGLYVDDIYSYLQGSRIPLVFYDMDRIEVFKGPQGSLYGRNAVGGAVAAHTARPTRELESYLSLQRAEFDWTTAEARLNVPLNDAFALRLSGYYDERDSYYSNVDPNRTEAGEEVKSGRVRLRYQPGDSLDVLLGFERVSHDGGPQILVPPAFGERLMSVSNTNGFSTRESDRFIALTNARLSPDVELRVITGHTAIESMQASDTNNLLIDALRGPFVGQMAAALEGYQFTQEVLLSSVATDGLQWLVGASYFKDHQETATNTQSGFPPVVPVVDSFTTGEATTRMMAAFIDLSYDITEKLRVDGSLRYSDEERTGRRSDSVVISAVTGLPFPAGAFRFKNDYSRLSPGATLSYFWIPQIMTYARVATAYQSGGINSRPQNVARAVFGPSTAISYELGAKTQWLDQRLMLNLGVFRMVQEDYQYQVNNPPFNEFQNIGEARTDGVEVELTAQLTDWLSVPLTFGYLDARLTKLISPRAGTVQGQPLFGIPKRTGTAGVQVELPLPAVGPEARFYLRADYFFAEERYLGASPVQLDDYRTLDFKAGVRFSKRYEIYAYGQNVFDDVHIITPALGQSAILSPPGRFGIGASLTLN
jgi:iron complex outermembrane receptor protein